MNQPKRIRLGERIPVRLSVRERDLILKHTVLGGELEKRIRIAPTEDSALLVGLTLDDLDELIGYVAAEANHSKDRKLAERLGDLFDRLRRIEESHTDEEFPAAAEQPISTTPTYTPKQGQYLSFIFYYTKIHGLPPAESDMQRYFRVSPPTVHQMVVTLEAKGLIERTPAKPRSLRVLLPRHELPDLE